MKLTQTFAAVFLTATVGMAQDHITLTNGDVITGKIKTMTDGKVTVTSPLLGGDVTIDLTQIENMTTESAVALQTTTGEIFKRRIVGIENSNLRLEGDIPSLAVDSLAMINPPEKKKPRWTGSVSIKGLYVDGNTHRRAVGALAEATRKTEIDRITADANWDYSEDRVSGSDWNLTQRRASAGLKYDYFIDEDRWYLLATTRVLGDTFANIRLRLTAGMGIGYTVINRDDMTLTTEVGLSYVDESYRDSTPSTDYLAARIAYKYTQQIDEKTRLTHGVEAYPSLENADDIYLQMTTALTTSLTNSMIASLSYVMDYDNTPSPGFRRDDHRVELSIGWTF